MENSAGSAEAEMEVIRDSVEYAMNTLKETFTSLAQHAIDRGGLKDLIKGATALLDIVDKIVSKIGLIPTIITTITGVMTAKRLNGNNGIFSRNSDNKLEIFGSQVNGGFKSWLAGLGKTNPEIKEQQRELQNATAAINQYHNAYKSKVMTEQIGNNVLNNSNRIVRDYGNAIRNGASESDAYTAAQKRLGSELSSVGKNGKTAGVGARAAAAGLSVLNTAASMLVSMGISAAINLLITAISESINAVSNHVDKIKELTEEENSLKSEIETLNSELTETKLKIDTLEKKPKLTLLEKGELQNLKEANDELERQIRLKQGELAIASRDKNKQAEELYDLLTTSASQRVNWTDFIPGVGGIVDAITDISNATQGNNLSQQLIDLDNYEKKLKKLAEHKNSEEYLSGDKKAEEKAKQMQEEVDKLHDTVQKYYNDSWSIIATGLDPSYAKNKTIISQFTSYMEKFDELNKKNFTTFFDVYNDPQFATVKQYLEDLAKQGKLTEDVFNSLTEEQVKGIDKFREALKNIPDADTQSVIEAIIEAIKNTGDEAENAGKKIKTFAEALDKVKEAVDKFVSTQEKLTDAFKKTQLGGGFTSEELYKIVSEMPELTKYFEKTTDGWTISAKNFAKASEELAQSEKENYQKTIDSLQEYTDILNKAKGLETQIKFSNNPSQADINAYNDALMEVQKVYDSLSIPIDVFAQDAELSKYSSQLSSDLAAYKLIVDLIDEKFDEHKSALDGMKTAYEDAKQEITKYNEAIKTLDNSLKNLNENSLLSYDELNSLLEIAPNLEYSVSEDGFSVSVEELEKIKEKSYEVRNAYIEDVKARVQAEIDAGEKSKAAAEKNLKEIQDTISDIGVDTALTQKAVEANQNLEEINLRLNYSYEILKKLDGLEQDIVANEGTKDKAQEIVDYYNTIISAIEIVRDKYTETIDKEIEALNDGKDALKEANDERQRELDLIEARNNLENAKKRKVWVYTGGRGFQQVQDQKAVKEAEEKYRSAIQSSQEAAIDKQISEKEKEKEALEDLTEEMTSLNDTINNAITVSEALKSLGIADEKDLLNLPDNVKNEIKNGLADAMINKNNENNKDNSKYTPVTLDDVLSNLGAKVTSADIDKLGLVTKSDFDSAVKNFSDSLKAYQEANVSNVTNNNSGTVISPTFNISGVTDPKEVAKVVNSEMTNLFTKLNNSIK